MDDPIEIVEMDDAGAAARPKSAIPARLGHNAGAAPKRYTSRMNDGTLEQIQTKIAFLERAASELSDALYRQHKEIQALEAKLKAVLDRLSGTQADESPRVPDQERPPHY
jgi:uncharacterized coiled-coil protein SlyX